MDDQESINHREWERPENWNAWGVYRSVRDTRVWVPKRDCAPGQTLNFAHRASWWSLAGLFIVPLGLALLFILMRVFR